MSLTPDQLAAARDWLADVFEPPLDMTHEDVVDALNDFPARAIERLIARKFDGGIPAFIATTN